MACLVVARDANHCERLLENMCEGAADNQSCVRPVIMNAKRCYGRLRYSVIHSSVHWMLTATCDDMNTGTIGHWWQNSLHSIGYHYCFIKQDHTYNRQTSQIWYTQSTNTHPQTPCKSPSHPYTTILLFLPTTTLLCSLLEIRSRQSLYHTRPIHEPRPKDPIRILKHSIFQTDDDELRAFESRLDQSANVLRMWEIQSGVDFV